LTQNPFFGEDGFKKFVFAIWKQLGLPDPTPLQYDICDYLVNAPKRSVIEAFRGVGKSWITSAFTVHTLYIDPQKKILVVSASKERADQFSTFTKRLINEIEFLKDLRPKEGQRDSVIAFDVGLAKPDHSPSVKSVGITGQLTGSRADLIIADDIEVVNNSATQTMRDKLSEQVKEFDAILKPLQDSRIIYLGTPQTEMSLYNQLPERGYEMRVWPSLFPTEKQVEGYRGTLAPYILNSEGESGMPTDPLRFNEVDLAERKASYGRAGFALQFMLDTTLSDADRYPLKIEDLVIANLPNNEASVRYTWGPTPELCENDVPCVGLTGDRFYRPMQISDTIEEYQGAVMSIDPSGRGADETGYAVVKHLHGQLFVTACGGLIGGYDDKTLRKLATICRDHKVKSIVIEANFGDGMFNNLLKPILQDIYPCTIEEVRHSKQKELRIVDTLEPVMMQHRLIIDKKLIKEDYESASKLPYSLFYQMTRLTRDKGALVHDDRLDALSIAVGYWVDSMARHIQKSVDASKDKALKEELKRFKAHVMNRQTKPRNRVWMN
tara:strand:+ start:3905 stop:5560 length:1656 start_codon:yes stop_codon:yes gene_type:complete